MKNIIRLNKQQKLVLFETAARQMKVSGVVIEKDFWVCVVLDYLLNKSKYCDYFIFKGGTSLSKCYAVIDRFSEDIDLVLKWDYLGFSDDLVLKEKTTNQNNKLEMLMNERAADFIQNELKNDLIENLSNKIAGLKIESDDTDLMTLYIYYPAVYDDSYILQRVKLEIGPVAAKTPTERKMIKPYCTIAYKLEEIKGFGVNVVSIARTFWEKVLILYSEYNRPLGRKMPLRYSRHYYDVFMIYKSEHFKQIMSDLGMFEEVRKFKTMYYRTSWSQIDKCRLDSITLVPCAQRIKEISQDYGFMSDMIFNNAPSFDEIVSGLTELECELRNSGNS